MEELYTTGTVVGAALGDVVGVRTAGEDSPIAQLPEPLLSQSC